MAATTALTWWPISLWLDGGALLACIAGAHHDAQGLVWPAAAAPYQVHLVALAGQDRAALETADRLYDALQAAGITVLYDDRDESPGVKFADADLIGLPQRVTVAARALRQGGVELKPRAGTDKIIVPLDEVTARLAEGEAP